MTMTATTATDLATLDHDEDALRIDVSAVAILNRSEVECQIDAAHKYRRSIQRFLLDARTLATMDRDVAESCIYSLPRGGKVITGPSVRLAEICASAYGNLHIGARVVGVEEKQVVAQAICWDLEKNVRVSIEARRRITKKDGSLYDDDMINVTGAAATSIALRTVIFRVIPRTYVHQVYEKVKEVAVGTLATLEQSRDAVLSRLNKAGITTERILARVGKPSAVDVGAVEIEQLIGLWSAMKDGLSPDEAFPAAAAAIAPAPPGAAQEGRKVSLRGRKGAPAPAAEAATAPSSGHPAAAGPGDAPFGTPAQAQPPRGPTPAGTTPEAHDAARRAHAAGGGTGTGQQAPPAGAHAAPPQSANPGPTEEALRTEADILYAELRKVGIDGIDAVAARIETYAALPGVKANVVGYLRDELAKRAGEVG